MRNNKILKLFGWGSILFLILPLIMIGITAFGSAPIIQFPIEGVTLKWFDKVFASRSLMSSLKTSLQLALGASSIALLIGVPASYALNKKKSKISRFLLSYFLSPSLIPGVVMGYALFKSLTLNLHLNVLTSLLIGHVLIVIPYTIRIVAAGLEHFDDSIEEAARSLGVKPIKTFFIVVLPNIKQTLIAAFMMSFINSFNNLPVSLFLKGPGINTLPSALMSHMEYNFDPSVSALSLLLMIGTFVLMIILESTLVSKEQNHD